MVEVAAFNATMTIKVNGNDVVLGILAAESVRVLDTASADNS